MLQENRIYLGIALFVILIIFACGLGYLGGGYFNPPVEYPVTRIVSVVVTATYTPTPTPTFTPTPVVMSHLDRQLAPHYGSKELWAGRPPDPHQVRLTSGGTIDVAQLNYGSDCMGFVDQRPQHEVIWDGRAGELRIFFKSEAADKNATIIIQDPNDTWHCSDNFEGLNPGVVIPHPVPGRYDIWVGSLNVGENLDGRLTVTCRPQLFPSNADAYLSGNGGASLPFLILTEFQRVRSGGPMTAGLLSIVRSHRSSSSLPTL